jgi:hypothetical protein
MDLREIGWGGLDWIDLSQDRDRRKALVNTVIIHRVLYNYGKFLSSCTNGGFSRRAQLHGVSHILLVILTYIMLNLIEVRLNRLERGKK